MRVTIRTIPCGSLATLLLLTVLSINVRAQIPQEGPALSNESAGSTANDGSAKSAVQAEQGEAQTSGSDFSLFRAVGGFGLVLCLILLGYLAARKFAPQYFVKTTSEKNLRLIETLAMGEKRTVAIVEFDEKRYLLGNTPNQITLLAELPGRLSLASEVRPSPALSFAASRNKPAHESFKSLYEAEQGFGMKGNGRHVPPDIRAKMRQLRASLER